MGGFVRFLGRLLFVTLLLTSAVVKIREPSTQVAAFTSSYNTLRDLYPSVTSNLPHTTTISTQIPLATVVRILGAIEALAALLIVFGDRLGGVILFGRYLIIGLVSYGPAIITAVSKQKVNGLITLLPQLSLFVIFLGLSLAFIYQRPVKRAAISG